MKVIEHIKNQLILNLAMRLFLLLRGKGIKIIIDMIEDLKKFNPPFIDVTSHSSHAQRFQNGKTF